MSIALDDWPLREPFVTADSSCDSIRTVTVELVEGGARGRGEAAGVDYLGETPEGLRERLESCRRAIEGLPAEGLPPEELDALLPAGGARNALDCALWDLRLKRAGRTIWDWLGLRPLPVVTAFTLSLEAPAAMASAARRAASHPLLKLKLDAADPVARVAAVRAARPDAQLIVDANASWSAPLLAEVGPALLEQRVSLVEQPLPRGADLALAGWATPAPPLCADESCQSLAELDAVADRYGFVNLKLDKCGGLTEALRMVERCRELGLGLMVGNMLGSSLAMAPAFAVAQHCRWVDLDGPLLQRTDREPPLRYEGGTVYPPAPALWG
jgi:L-alanine-DL-glutamate epimerase-like enolase superfamily enzyme